MSLAQYRGKSPVYLALFRGLYCSFCRRHVVHLGSIAEKLREVGVQTLGVVATDPERARFYFKFRPPRMPMGADPELMTHQAYGLPNFPLTPEAVDIAKTAAARELRRLNQPVAGRSARGLDEARRVRGHARRQRRLQAPSGAAHRHLPRRPGRHRPPRLRGMRPDGPATFGEMPSAEEILASARAL